MMAANRASFALVIDGNDIAAGIAPHLSPGGKPLTGEKKPVARLVSISLTEKLGEEADELEIVLANHDGAIKPVKRGVYLTFSLGWAAGPEVKKGLVDKGRFIVDEVEKEGPPDTLKIKARSADFTGDFRKRKDKAWKDTTLGAILNDVAANSGYATNIHPDLGSIPIKSIEQAAKSNAAFVRDLGERYDAIATVKDRTLVFLPIGSQDNAAGGTFGSNVLTRRGNCRWRFTVPDREQYDGAEAKWHDRGAAKKKIAKSGGSDNAKRIKRSFASEAEAKAAADAEARKAKRGLFKFEYEMALGDPGIEPNGRVTLQGWDSEIDGVKWLVNEASHTLDGNAGLHSTIRLVSVEA